MLSSALTLDKGKEISKELKDSFIKEHTTKVLCSFTYKVNI